MFRLLFVVAVVYAKTVRYTNVPPGSSRNTRTYEIEVPGKPPIRIIEADPLWNNNIHGYPYRENLEHRAVKLPHAEQLVTTQPTTVLVENSTKIYSPEALNAFLKNYAEKLREKKQEKNTTEHPPKEQIDRLSDISLEESNENIDKSKRWGLVDVKNHNHPFEDKNGWVTMEAVPWSSSKISKWHTNVKYEPKPDEYRPYENHGYPTFSNQPQDYASNENNGFNNGYKKPYSSYDINVRPPFPSKPQNSRPTKPMYGYDQTPLNVKPRPEYNFEQSRPASWDRPSSSYNIHLSTRPDPWQQDNKPYPQLSINYDGYPIDEHRDIITDGKPGDFPSRSAPHRRPYEPLQDRPSNDVHPAQHPVNGNGEWVLLSTTKGYQYPKAKQQRSLDVAPNSVGTKRSVRLTVLPPDDNSKVNMTTSHGGLLEVESTFETVEQSHRIFSERLQQNKTSRPILKLKRRPAKSQIKSGSSPIPVQQVHQGTIANSRTHNPDPSAVLAAIGAGMVPATMAMLMPFVNGRRRRSIESNVVNVTRVPFFEYELTLQRSY